MNSLFKLSIISEVDHRSLKEIFCPGNIINCQFCFQIAKRLPSNSKKALAELFLRVARCVYIK